MTPPLKTPKQTPTALKDIHGPGRARSRADHPACSHRHGRAAAIARQLTLVWMAALVLEAAGATWLACTYLLHTTGPAAVLLALVAAGAITIKLHCLRRPPPQTSPPPTSTITRSDSRKDPRA